MSHKHLPALVVLWAPLTPRHRCLMLLAAAADNSFKEAHTLFPIPLLLIHFHIIEMRGVSPAAETRLEGRAGKQRGRARWEPRRELRGWRERRAGQVKEERWNQGGEEETRGVMGCERPRTEIKGGKGGGWKRDGVEEEEEGPPPLPGLLLNSSFWYKRVANSGGEKQRVQWPFIILSKSEATGWHTARRITNKSINTHTHRHKCMWGVVSDFGKHTCTSAPITACWRLTIYWAAELGCTSVFSLFSAFLHSTKCDLLLKESESLFVNTAGMRWPALLDDQVWKMCRRLVVWMLLYTPKYTAILLIFKLYELLKRCWCHIGVRASCPEEWRLSRSAGLAIWRCHFK